MISLHFSTYQSTLFGYKKDARQQEQRRKEVPVLVPGSETVLPNPGPPRNSPTAATSSSTYIYVTSQRATAVALSSDGSTMLIPDAGLIINHRFSLRRTEARCLAKLDPQVQNRSPNREQQQKEKTNNNQSLLSRHLNKIYPIGLHRSNSSFSLSSVSLSLSQNSNDSSHTDHSSTPLEQKISMALRLIASPGRRSELSFSKSTDHQQQLQRSQESPPPGDLRRCHWISKNSDKVYVAFHDEQWGVPVYDDSLLFELLSLSGMLMDYNWTEILKRKELLREAFSGFDPNVVAEMGEEEISEIASNKAISLTETRVRCIVDNAKCVEKVARENGSFSSYIWGTVNYKPMINKYRHPRNVPLRTPKAESVSKELVKRGFRLVGPVIVCSFMQAAGLSIDHLVDCFRHSECVSLAERPWRHI